jgi:hypothetical protein
LLEHRHERREIADHADPVILPAVKHRGCNWANEVTGYQLSHQRARPLLTPPFGVYIVSFITAYNHLRASS